MTTFLSMVNDLRHLLREEVVSSAAGSGGDLMVQKALLNRAARKVLTRRPWSFLQRNDGYLFFPAAFRSTSGFSVGQGQVVATLSSLPSADGLRFTAGQLLAKVGFTDAAGTFSDTSFALRSINLSFGFFATLAAPYEGASYAGGGVVFANEAALPSTVARVLSVRNEEGSPVRFETVDAFDDFDRAFPQDQERFGERIEFVAVGGSTQTTSRNNSSGPLAGFESRTGLGVRVYPVPDAPITLRYSYVARVADLVNDADELVGVPAEVADHIVRVAFEEALMGSIEDDPRRGITVRAQNEADYRELVGADRRDVGRRYIPPPFSSRAMRHPRRLHDTIPEP